MGKWILLFLIMFNSIVVFGQVNVLYHEQCFTIVLPNNWEKIPQDIISEYERSVRSQYPDHNKEINHIVCGFNLKKSKNWLDYPYILISRYNVGKLPYSELSKFKKVNLRKIFNKNKDTVPFSNQNIKFNQVHVDEENYMLWTLIEMKHPSEGTIKSLSGVVLTEIGSFQFYGYSKNNEFERFLPEFINILKSLEPVDKLKYNPKRIHD